LKKLASISLLVCLLFNLAGYQLIFHFQRQLVRTEMENILKAHSDRINTERFIFSSGSEAAGKINWENDREFCFNGKMYDLVERQNMGDKIIIVCVNDRKETDLFSKLDDNVRENERSNKVINDLLQFMQTWFHENGSGPLFLEMATEPKAGFNMGELSFRAKDILTPPPQRSNPHLFLL
jgi:hypothetical protein